MSRLLEKLRECRRRDDRGMMANLRCILVENKKHRAWPALNRLGVRIDDEVKSFISGLYATHSEETSTGDFGTTCKAIERARNETNKDSKLTPTERRFQHLLAAKGWDELRDRVYGMVRMAKTQDVHINYEQLEIDLKRLSGDSTYWHDRTKTEWASAFWSPGSLPDDEEKI